MPAGELSSPHSIAHKNNNFLDRYPLEFIFLGWKPNADNLTGQTTEADKLSTVSDGRSLRLFVWKLHNAVSASVERGEVSFNVERGVDVT